MKNLKTGRRILVLGSLAAVAACDPDAPTGPSPVGAVAVSAVRQGLHPRTARDEFRALSLRAPGFAGLYLDTEGQLVINVSTDDFSAQSRAEVLDWLVDQGRPEVAAQTPKMRRVAFDYATLDELYSSVADRVASLPGVSTLRIDPVVGRIVVGASDGDAARSIGVALRALPLPIGAAEVEESGRVVEVGLQDRISPRVGGIQTSRSTAAQAGSCSIGLVGWRQVEPGQWQRDPDYVAYTTASHCTSNQEAVMGDVFGQPTASQRTGVEVDEAAVFTGYPCPSGQRCRYADVAVIHIDDSVSVIQLNVARSSKVAEGTNPPYNGYQAYAGSNVQGVLVGDVVTKVGRTTGQSSARVDQNCVDIQSSSNPGLWTLCSQMAKLGVRGGDSGGTVFVPKVTGNSSTPRAAGVIFAGNLSGTESYFSPIGYVHSSLGYRFIFY